MPVVEEDDFVLLPEGEYFIAALTELKHKTVEWVDKKTAEPKSWEKLEWWFEITAGEFAGRKVKGESDARITTHPNNTYRLWAEALLDLENGMPAGFEFEESDLLGLRCKVQVQHTPDRKDPNKVWANVSAVDRLDATFDEPPF